MNIHDFSDYKKQKRKISMLTVYDYTSAKILASSNVDCVLVGDSLAMTMHGYDSTIHASVEMMALHTKAVCKAMPNKFVVGDMPFLSFRKGKYECIEAARALMLAGANAVKIESLDGHEDCIQFLVESGIPVMGHLGLTPQYFQQLGGYKLQGKETQAADKIYSDAKRLQDLGCFSLVLECIPAALAQKISTELEIACIGIGAGSQTDGQVLVWQDMLGMNQDFKPKFVKKYMDAKTAFVEAINLYCQEVQEQKFPSDKETYY